MIIVRQSRLSRLVAAAVLLLGASMTIPGAAAAQGTSATEAASMTAQKATEFRNTLRAGGFVILVRHGATFTNQADTDPLHLANVSKQRLLNDQGKALAREFGAAIRAARIPVGEVYTSQFNRAYQTAELAGFKDIEATAGLSEGGLVVTPEENARRANALRQLLSKPPARGTNTILITHKPNIVDALGKDWFDVKEGEASIFKPDGTTYRLIGRLQMADWPKLAG
jgi:broad specificity phosphatase PhoE